MCVCWSCNASSDEEHHINPKRFGGSDSKDNLVQLCIECHDIVDATNCLTKKQLEKIALYPKLLILLTSRLVADLYHVKAMARVEQQVLETAINVLINPGDVEPLEKLQGAVIELNRRNSNLNKKE